MQVKDKVVIITGGGRGIGRAIAIAYAAEGARVVIAARNTPQLDEVVAEIEAKDGEVLAVPTDVQVRSEVENDGFRLNNDTWFGLPDKTSKPMVYPAIVSFNRVCLRFRLNDFILWKNRLVSIRVVGIIDLDIPFL